MDRPVQPQDVVLTAFKEGAKKLSDVGGSTEVLERNSSALPDMKTQMFFEQGEDDDFPPFQQRLKPGQHYDGSGKTIFNPPRSSPEVEAVLGEKKYNPKPRPESSDMVRLKVSQMEAQIQQQNNMIAELVAKLSGGKTETIPEPPTPDPDATEGVEINKEPNEWNEIRSQAKALGIKVYGKSKEQITSEVEEAKSKVM